MIQTEQIDVATTAFNAANQIAQALSNEWERHRALATIIDALASAGQWDMAHCIAATSAELQVTLVGALAKDGQWDTASQMAGSITGETWRIAALIKLAYARFVNQQGEDAAAALNMACGIAESIPDNHLRASELVKITRALMDIGQVDIAVRTFSAARQAADFYYHWNSQSMVLSDLAQVLARADLSDRRVVDLLCSTWRSCMTCDELLTFFAFDRFALERAFQQDSALLASQFAASFAWVEAQLVFQEV